MSTVRQLIAGAKSALAGVESCWIRVRVSDFSPLEAGSDHRRLTVHPIDLDCPRSPGATRDTWEGRLWRNDLARLQTFLQGASDEGQEFDALVRLDVNARAGMVLIIEGVRF